MTSPGSRIVAGRAEVPARPPDVDVIILAMNRIEETLAAIDSALAQTGVTRRVIVVDQGSTPENLARLAARIEGRSDAVLLALDRNYGVAGGRNRASALGNGRIIAALDNDAEFAEPGTLASAVAAIDADPTLAAIGFRITVFATAEEDLSSWGYPSALLPRARDTFDTVTFVGAGHAIRRAAWSDAGGYDDALFFCWEEYDFCLRAIARGWRIRYHGDIVVRHKVSGQHRFAWSGTRWFYFVRNRLYIGRKTGASWAALAPRWLAYLLKGLRNGAAGQSLRALPAAIRLSRGVAPIFLTPAARAYITSNDAAYRGSVWRRIRTEVLAALPGRP